LNWSYKNKQNGSKVPRSSLYVEGLADTQKRFRRLPKDIKAAADDEVRAVARFVANETQAAASTRAEQKVAKTIKAQKNSVSLGGGGRKQAAGNMALGTEFGGRGRSTTQQFRSHRGTQGYFFWPAIRRNSTKIKEMWDEMLERILRDMNGG